MAEIPTPLFDVASLSNMTLFAGLDELALAAICERLAMLWIPSGNNLFAEDDVADAMYVLLSGTLAVIQHDANQQVRLLGLIHAGETVGEMAILSGRNRSATVQAIRDCEVARFSRADFENLMARQPSAMLQLARLAFARLEAASLANARPQNPAKAFCVVPVSSQHRGDQFTDFIEQFQLSLSRFGTVAVINESDGQNRSSSDFNAIEQRYRYLIYTSSSASGAWFDLCKRQSDEWLLLDWPESRDGASIAAISQPITPPSSLEAQPLKRQHWISIQSLASTLSCASAFILTPQAKVHHVKQSKDIDRIVRLLTGHATGLVLGGGGARGFAHLGVIRALREHDLQIDAVGGTSIGAVIAAGVAMEWSDEELYARYHRSFVAKNPLRDYTLPFIALVAGRQATQHLRREYGDWLIEDLRLPYFCVSTNLTRGVVKEHHQGPLWHALRASIAIPGILPPVFHQQEVYVDGGVINNLPIDVMRKNIGGRVIGVDIAGDYAIRAGVDEANLPPLWRMMADWFKGLRPRPNILQILLRSGMVNSASVSELNRSKSDCLIQPPVEQLELLDWQCFDRAIQIGYTHTRALIEKGLWQ
jgi:NTE family protein